MSKGCYFVKKQKSLDFSIDEKKEENFCPKCGAEMVLTKAGQGWGFESIDRCPNCPPDNHKYSKGFGG